MLPTGNCNVLYPTIAQHDPVSKLAAVEQGAILNTTKSIHAPIAADLPIDHRLLPLFRLHKRLGKGAYGLVWEATFVPTGQKFAIKKACLNGKNDLDFQQESLMLQELASIEGTLRLHLAVHDANAAYLVTDLHSGGSFWHFLAYQGLIYLDREQAIFYFQQLIRIITDMHMDGFIHRDIKLDNLLVDDNGNVVLGDMGMVHEFEIPESWSNLTPLSRLSAISSLRPFTNIQGTPNYMAPEVWDAQTDRGYGPAVDFWAAVVCYFVMRTGRDNLWAHYLEEPFPNIEELARRIIEEDIRIYPEDELSPIEVDFFTQALKRNPQERLSPQQLIEHPLFSLFGRDWDDLGEPPLKPASRPPPPGLGVDAADVFELTDPAPDSLLARANFNWAADDFKVMIERFVDPSLLSSPPEEFFSLSLFTFRPQVPVANDSDRTLIPTSAKEVFKFSNLVENPVKSIASPAPVFAASFTQSTPAIKKNPENRMKRARKPVPPLIPSEVLTSSLKKKAPVTKPKPKTARKPVPAMLSEARLFPLVDIKSAEPKPKRARKPVPHLTLSSKTSASPPGALLIGASQVINKSQGDDVAKAAPRVAVSKEPGIVKVAPRPTPEPLVPKPISPLSSPMTKSPQHRLVPLRGNNDKNPNSEVKPTTTIHNSKVPLLGVRSPLQPLAMNGARIPRPIPSPSRLPQNLTGKSTVAPKACRAKENAKLPPASTTTRTPASPRQLPKPLMLNTRLPLRPAMENPRVGPGKVAPLRHPLPSSVSKQIVNVCLPSPTKEVNGLSAAKATAVLSPRSSPSPKLPIAQGTLRHPLRPLADKRQMHHRPSPSSPSKKIHPPRGKENKVPLPIARLPRRPLMMNSPPPKAKIHQQPAVVLLPLCSPSSSASKRTIIPCTILAKENIDTAASAPVVKATPVQSSFPSQSSTAKLPLPCIKLPPRPLPLANASPKKHQKYYAAPASITAIPIRSAKPVDTASRPAPVLAPGIVPPDFTHSQSRSNITKKPIIGAEKGCSADHTAPSTPERTVAFSTSSQTQETNKAPLSMSNNGKSLSTTPTIMCHCWPALVGEACMLTPSKTTSSPSSAEKSKQGRSTVLTRLPRALAQKRITGTVAAPPNKCNNHYHYPLTSMLRKTRLLGLTISGIPALTKPASKLACTIIEDSESGGHYQPQTTKEYIKYNNGFEQGDMMKKNAMLPTVGVI